MADLLVGLRTAVEAYEVALYDTTGGRHQSLDEVQRRWLFIAEHGPELLALMEAVDAMQMAYDHDGGGGLCAEYMQACQYVITTARACGLGGPS